MVDFSVFIQTNPVDNDTIVCTENLCPYLDILDLFKKEMRVNSVANPMKRGSCLYRDHK